MFNRGNFNQGIRIPKFLAIFFSEYYSYFVLLVFVVSLLFSYFLILKPKFDKMNETKLAYNSEQETKQMELSRNIASLNQYKKSFAQINEIDKEKILAMIPEDKKFENIFPWMEKIIEGEMINGARVGGLGFLLDSITIDTKEKNTEASENDKSGENFQKDVLENIGIIEITMTVSGVNYDTVKILLDELEKNLRLIDVRGISFSENSVKLVVNTYYFKNLDLVAKSRSMGNSREPLNLSIFDLEQYKNLKYTDFPLPSLEALKNNKGNNYPFGLNEAPEEEKEEENQEVKEAPEEDGENKDVVTTE